MKHVLLYLLCRFKDQFLKKASNISYITGENLGQDLNPSSEYAEASPHPLHHVSFFFP